MVQLVKHRVLVRREPGASGCSRVETYPNHCEEGTGGAKDCLGWCSVRDLLRGVRGFDCHIQ